MPYICCQNCSNPISQIYDPKSQIRGIKPFSFDGRPPVRTESGHLRPGKRPERSHGLTQKGGRPRPTACLRCKLRGWGRLAWLRDRVIATHLRRIAYAPCDPRVRGDHATRTTMSTAGHHHFSYHSCRPRITTTAHIWPCNAHPDTPDPTSPASSRGDVGAGRGRWCCNAMRGCGGGGGLWGVVLVTPATGDTDVGSCCFRMTGTPGMPRHCPRRRARGMTRGAVRAGLTSERASPKPGGFQYLNNARPISAFGSALQTRRH